MSAIFVINIKEYISDEKRNHFEQIVSRETREKIAKYKFREDYLRSLYGEVLVRKIVSEKVGISPKKIVIRRNEFGKPYIENISNIHFNISHSGDWVACIVSDYDCGIDIECIKDTDLKIAERFFHEEECAALFNKNDKLNYFFELWTLKESYVKYKGKGLHIPLGSFSIIEKNEKYEVHPETENLVFTQYDCEEEYKIAACTLDKIEQIKRISVDDIAEEWRLLM